MAKNDRVEKAFETLKEGVIDLVKNPSKLEETMRHYGDYYEYNQYSPYNTMLLIFETAFIKGRRFQMARGFKQWQTQFNRQVNKGEKAMWILAPRKRKIVEVDEETGEETTTYVMSGFRSVPVFELCQTSGEPLERPTKNHEYKSLNELDLNDFIEKCGVPVEFEDLLYSNGYTDGKRIVIGTHNDELASICTLFHELAHFHLHFNREGERVELYRDESVSLKELEAEAVAYMVSSALGIENSYSKKYISNWNKDNGNLNEEFEERSCDLLMEALNQIDLFIDCIDA